MSAAHILVGLGLALDVLGTLFISLDAYKGQEQTTKIYDLLAYVTGFEIIDLRGEPVNASTDAIVAEAERRASTSTDPAVQQAWNKLKEFDELVRPAVEAEAQGVALNKELLKAKLDGVSTDFRSRRRIIWTAVMAVLVGGVLEFIGGVFF